MRSAIMTGVLVTALGAAGCARDRTESAGPMVQRNYEVGAFDRIELAGAYEATVRTGAAPSVHAKGGEKVLEHLVVEIDGDTLKVHPRKRGFSWGGWGKGSRVELTITVPALKAAELAGSGGMRIDRVTGDSFNGGVAGSGNLNIDRIEVEQLKIGIAGSGNANAGTGTARTVEYEIAGSGAINARGVAAEDASISIAGSGGVVAQATGTAKVDIAGSGDVDLTGGAKCSVSKAGSGDVRCS